MKNSRQFLSVLLTLIGVASIGQSQGNDALWALIKQEDQIRLETGETCAVTERTQQSKSFAEMMDYALALHDTATSKATEEMALSETVRVTRAYPENWIGHYWACHLYTQVGRLFDDNDVYIEYVDKAREHLTLAWKYCKGATKEDKSELFAEEALLHRQLAFTMFNPRRNVNIDKSKADEYVKESMKFLELAYEENSKNPRVHLQRGITSTYNGDFDKGIEQLEYALELYEKYPAPNKVYPNWGEAWISVWLPRAKKLAEQN